MKITQEQIEAALRWVDVDLPNFRNSCLVFDQFCDDTKTVSYDQAAMKILAAAYREKCEELEGLKTKRCDFCNELPQSENEKAYAVEFCDHKGDLPTMDEWLATKGFSNTSQREIILTKCGSREELGEKPNIDF